ncbi:hypothetical protein ACQP2X_44270 [Actinoplanes sp. CA-131856]
MPAETRERCPLYCTTNHKRDDTKHAHLIAEVDVVSDKGIVAVNLVRRGQFDEVELMMGRGWSEPAITDMTVEEARALRDALNVAVAVLERT